MRLERVKWWYPDNDRGIGDWVSVGVVEPICRSNAERWNAEAHPGPLKDGFYGQRAIPEAKSRPKRGGVRP